MDLGRRGGGVNCIGCWIVLDDVVVFFVVVDDDVVILVNLFVGRMSWMRGG